MKVRQDLSFQPRARFSDLYRLHLPIDRLLRRFMSDAYFGDFANIDRVEFDLKKGRPCFIFSHYKNSHHINAITFEMLAK